MLPTLSRPAIVALWLAALLVVLSGAAKGQTRGTPLTSARVSPSAAAQQQADAPTQQGSRPDPLDSRLGPWNKSVLLALGALACIFVAGFIAAIVRGDVPRLESDLGGFGGGLGGWQVSTSLAFLLGAVALSLCVTVLAWNWMSPAAPSDKAAPSGPEATEHPATTPAGGPATGR